MPENPMPESFRKALFSHKHTLVQLRRKLVRVPTSQRADALLAVFADRERTGSAYQDQEVAGRLLTSLKPELRQSLEPPSGTPPRNGP